MDFDQIVLHFPRQMDFSNASELEKSLQDQNMFEHDIPILKKQLANISLTPTGYESEFWSSEIHEQRKPVKIIWN